jgi:hypothetical protein
MTLEEVMNRIESPSFSAVANLASGLKTFLRIVADQPEVQALAEQIKSAGVPITVFGRILDLATSPVEEGCEHPADAALAVYLWLLAGQDQQYAEIAAGTILVGDHYWWARKVAESVRSATRFRSAAGLVSSVLNPARGGVDYTAHASETVFAVPSLQQFFGRVNRAQVQGGMGIIIVPIHDSDLIDVFKNRESHNRIADVLVGE